MTRPWTSALFGLYWLGQVATVVAEVAPQPLLAIDQPPGLAVLLAGDTAGQVWFRRGTNASSEAAVPSSRLVSWGAPVEATSGAIVLLADGGQVVGGVPSSDGERVVVENGPLGKLTLAANHVRAVMVRPPLDAQRRDALANRLCASEADEPPRDSDFVLVENGDEFLGDIVSLDAQKIELKTDVGRVSVELSKVVGIAFNPSLLAPPRPDETRAWVGLGDGSLLAVASWNIDDNAARLVLPAGTLHGGEALLAVREIVTFLQPLGGAATYLSDLPPEGYKHVPYLSLDWPYRLDRNVAGTRLRAGGRLYAKGVGLHSTARLTWKLAEAYRRFEAEVAIDDETVGRGSAVVRVFADSEQRYLSPPIRGGDRPLSVSVDLAGATRLSLIVDFGERGDTLDHVDWLNARLVR